MKSWVRVSRGGTVLPSLVAERFPDPLKDGLEREALAVEELMAA